MSKIRLTNKVVSHIVSIARSSKKTPTQIYSDLLNNPRWNPSLKPKEEVAKTFPLNHTSFYYLGALGSIATLSPKQNSIRARVNDTKAKLLTDISDYFEVGSCESNLERNGLGTTFVRYSWNSDHLDFIAWIECIGLMDYMLKDSMPMKYKDFSREFLVGVLDGARTSSRAYFKAKFNSSSKAALIQKEVEEKLGYKSEVTDKLLVFEEMPRIMSRQLEKYRPTIEDED